MRRSSARDVLRQPTHVRDDLQPERVLRATTDSHQPARRRPHGRHRLQVVPYAVGRPLQTCPVEVCLRVREGQPGVDAARIGIVDRCPLTREIGQTDHAFGAGWNPCRRFSQRDVGVRAPGCLSRQLRTTQVVAEPARQCPSRRHATVDAVAIGKRERRRPHPRVRHGIIGDVDEEHGRPVHDHHVAGIHDADADRFGGRIDRPRRHRSPGFEPGLAAAAAVTAPAI